MLINVEGYQYDTEVRADDEMFSLAERVQDALESKGYIVVKGFPVDTNDVQQCREKFLEITGMVGKAISHDANNSIIWDIKANPKSGSLIKTYSEHSHEAELHTDSQYSVYPEDYFALLTLKKARCGGGESFLLSLENILKELRALPNGQELEFVLRESDFPFIVPNVFKKTASEGNEYNFGPILRDNEIRFRIDTFEKAIAEKPEYCTNEQLDAYKALQEIILNSPSTEYFFLEEGDLIFINNKTMLHGRKQFLDPERHLLRIRMNKFGAHS